MYLTLARIQTFVYHSVIQCFFVAFLLFDYCSFCFFFVDYYSVYFSVLILELYSRYFDPLNYNHPAVNKHHRADSTIFVLVLEARPYYHHRHSGEFRNQFFRTGKADGESPTLHTLFPMVLYVQYNTGSCMSARKLTI